MDNNYLISYGMAFVSFIKPKLENVNEIILFGSVARNEADNNSDIDLFFSLNKKEDESKIKKLLNLQLGKFLKSKLAEPFLNRGIKNSIITHVGLLDEWELRRSIISEGIVLYGKYKELPKNQEQFNLFVIEPIKNITKRNKIVRALFGRSEKGYNSLGILSQINGKILSPRSFIVHASKSNEIIKILSKEKISYSLYEIWSDQF